MITITILNPIDIAHQESRLARFASKITPNLVRKKVDETIAKQIKEELTAQGVDAVIEILED